MEAGPAPSGWLPLPESGVVAQRDRALVLLDTLPIVCSLGAEGLDRAVNKLREVVATAGDPRWDDDADPDDAVKLLMKRQQQHQRRRQRRGRVVGGGGGVEGEGEGSVPDAGSRGQSMDGSHDEILSLLSSIGGSSLSSIIIACASALGTGCLDRGRPLSAEGTRTPDNARMAGEPRTLGPASNVAGSSSSSATGTAGEGTASAGLEPAGLEAAEACLEMLMVLRSSGALRLLTSAAKCLREVKALAAAAGIGEADGMNIN